MRHSTIAAVLLALALAGYSVGARPTHAQVEVWPVSTGELITLTFSGGGTRGCAVVEVKGSFARCGMAPERPSVSVGRREPPEQWVNLAQVEWITKARVTR